MRRARAGCISRALPLISYSTVNVLARPSDGSPNHDGKCSSRLTMQRLSTVSGVHSSLQRISNVKSAAPVLDASWLAILCTSCHDINQRSCSTAPSRSPPSIARRTHHSPDDDHHHHHPRCTTTTDFAPGLLDRRPLTRPSMFSLNPPSPLRRVIL